MQKQSSQQISTCTTCVQMYWDKAKSWLTHMCSMYIKSTKLKKSRSIQSFVHNTSIGNSTIPEVREYAV